jgi:hypothetical protein
MDLKEIVKLQMVEIDKLRLTLGQVTAERDELRQHLQNLAPGAPDAHACLRRIYNDPEAKDAERGKAAAAAIGYEKAKPAATVNNVFSLANYLDQQAQLRKQQAAKVIEHEPKTPWPPPSGQPLDLSAEASPTILGEGPEPAA